MFRLHPGKCKTMRMDQSSMVQWNYKHFENGRVMEHLDSEKYQYISVHINKLTFEKHICEKVNKANSLKGVKDIYIPTQYNI